MAEMSSPDFARIAAWLGERDGILAIDTRMERVRLSRHWWRPWLRGGGLTEELLDVDPAAPEQVLDRLELIPGLRVAIIVPHRVDTWGLFSEQLASHDTIGTRVVQIVDHDGALLINASELPLLHEDDRTGTSVLTVSARNSVHLENLDFPTRVRFAVRPDVSADVVRLSVRSPFDADGSRLPAPIWLRVTPDAERKRPFIDVSIDIVPSQRRDEWRCYADGATLARIHEPSRGDPLARVAFVLDRTCPDRNRFEEALDVANDTFRSTASVAATALNEGVRAGLIDAAISHTWPVGATGALYWFADVAGHGLAVQSHQLEHGWGSSGHSFALPEGLVQLINNLTYAPGLDVWDPLEEALSLAIPFFEDRRGGTLIIVGNSPPRVATVDGPFGDVARTFGFPTTSRVPSERWSEALAALDALGVNVWYLFLRLDSPGPELQPDYQRFDALQSRVENALRASLNGRVMTVHADRDGVARGVAALLRQSTAAGVNPSRMEVVDAEQS